MTKGKLIVKKLPASDSGRMMVRLNIAYRTDIPRYGVAKLTNIKNSRCQRVLILGHDDDESIFMPFDIRKQLSVSLGDELEFSTTPATKVEKFRWFCSSPDPAVRIPAKLSVASLVLGILSVLLALYSIFVK